MKMPFRKIQKQTAKAKKATLERVLPLSSFIAPTYLVRESQTNRFGVQQVHTGKFFFQPQYELDEPYDLTKKYAIVGITEDQKLFLVEETG